MSSIITSGFGSKNLIITGGYGGVFKVEVKKVAEVGYAPHWEIRVFEKKFPVLGDTAFDFRMKIKVRGIKDLHGLILALQDEEPSTEDDILELLSIYNQLKAQIKFEGIVEQKTLELFSETKKLLDKLFQKLKQEIKEEKK